MKFGAVAQGSRDLSSSPGQQFLQLGGVEYNAAICAQGDAYRKDHSSGTNKLLETPGHQHQVLSLTCELAWLQAIDSLQ